MKVKNIMMRCCMLFLLGASTSALAITRDYGFYAGLNGGIDRIKQMVDPAYKVTFDKEGLAGRIHAGFLFGENFSAEFGYSMFHRMKYKEDTNTFKQVTKPDGTEGYQRVIKVGSIRYRAIDIIAKGMIPFDYGFGVYADAGIGYIRSKLTTTPEGDTVDFFDNSTNRNKLTMVYGLGFSYDTADARLNMGWKRFQKRNNFPSIDVGYIGGSYFFG